MLALLFTGLGTYAQEVEVTDITARPYAIYIEPFETETGGETTITVQMKNEEPVGGYDFNLELPEGISVASNGNGGWMIEPYSGTPSAFFKTNFKDGKYIVAAAELYTPRTFVYGPGGPICAITLKTDADMEPGDYPVIISKIGMGLDDGTDPVQGETNMTTQTRVTVKKGDGRMLLDETSTIMPAEAYNTDVRVRRTIKAGAWNTICLPFSMTGTQVTDAFGADVELCDFIGYEAAIDDEDNTTGITVKFQNLAPTDGMEANHPYLIRVAANVEEFTADGVDVTPEEEPTVATVKRTKRAWSELIGTYVANTTVPAHALFINANKFWYSTGNTKMKAFRAYFDLYDELTDVEEAFSNVVMSFEDVPTGIVDVASPAGAATGIYNLQGQRLGDSSEQVARLPQGIYIINGKKTVKK